MKMLKEAGYEAFVVGGCVRDTLLGKTPHDWDITTSAIPEKVKELFKNYKQIDSGVKHGTTMVIIEEDIVEITTFRIDGMYSDGRRPDTVTYTKNIEDDLSRRDFTINACAAEENTLIDPFGGQKDLELHQIRCVGEPKKRFTEDSLRILRGMRFASELNFHIEDETKTAMFYCSNLLVNVSQERITAEFCKILLGSNVRNILTEFQTILVQIIPEMRASVGFQQHNPHHVYTVFDHILRTVEAIDSDTVLRTTMLLHDIGKPACFTMDNKGIGHFYGHPDTSAAMAQKILQRMRYSSSDAQMIIELIKNHDRKINPTPSSIKNALKELGIVQFQRLLKVKKADIMAQNPANQKINLQYLQEIDALLFSILQNQECFSLKELAVSGNDLIMAGFPENQRIGSTLNRLLDLVIEGKLKNDKDVLIKKARSFL